MRIHFICGKRLVAMLGELEPVDAQVCQQITDRCRTRKTTEVALVYPLRRLDEVRAFMVDVATITGHPVQGFSHDSHDIARDMPNLRRVQ